MSNSELQLGPEVPVPPFSVNVAWREETDMALLPFPRLPVIRHRAGTLYFNEEILQSPFCPNQPLKKLVQWGLETHYGKQTNNTIDRLVVTKYELVHPVSYQTKYSKTEIRLLFDKLYQQIKHGDEEHQTWLLNKINQFVKENI